MNIHRESVKLVISAQEFIVKCWIFSDLLVLTRGCLKSKFILKKRDTTDGTQNEPMFNVLVLRTRSPDSRRLY